MATLTKEQSKTQDGEQRLTKDVYARVTDRIIADLEKGIRPWMKPWHAEHAAGKITSAASVRRLIDAGADFPILGRAAVLHHDYPKRFAADPDFTTIALPVTRAYLRAEGLSPPFVEYMNNWPGFVAAEEPAEASAG